MTFVIWSSLHPGTARCPFALIDIDDCPFRCHVGTSREHWRPCSDQYYPFAGGPPQSWPVTYIHHTGPPPTPPTGAPVPARPSSTSPPPPPPPPFQSSPSPSLPPPPPIRPDDDKTVATEHQHEPSLVDRFLSIFKSSSSDVSAARVPAPRTVAYDDDRYDGFLRVVDVANTDRPQAAAADRLYLYGATSNRFRSRFMRRKHYVQ